MNTARQRPTHLCHPDIEWHWSASTPGASLYRGHDELHKGLDTWVESWDELVIEPLEVLEEGDYVFVMTHTGCAGRAAASTWRHRSRTCTSIEDGLLRRWWMFGDADKARRRFLAGDRPG